MKILIVCMDIKNKTEIVLSDVEISEYTRLEVIEDLKNKKDVKLCIQAATL